MNVHKLYEQMFVALDRYGRIYVTNDTTRNDQYWNETKGWTMADDATVLTDPKQIPRRPQPIVPEWADSEVMWLLGFFFTCGTAAHRPYFMSRPWKATFTGETRWLNRARATLTQMGAVVTPSIDTSTVTCHDQDVVEWLIEMFYDGGDTATKHIPRLMMNTSNEVVCMFMAGVEETTGALITNDISLDYLCSICTV